MAVPKKKTSKSKKAMRSAGKSLVAPKAYRIDDAAHPIRSHMIDSKGFYNGRQVILPKVKKSNDDGENSSENEVSE